MKTLWCEYICLLALLKAENQSVCCLVSPVNYPQTLRHPCFLKILIFVTKCLRIKCACDLGQIKSKTVVLHTVFYLSQQLHFSSKWSNSSWSNSSTFCHRNGTLVSFLFWREKVRNCDLIWIYPSSAPCDLLGSPPLVFHLIHSPHSAFHILHTHETLVQAQVVAHSVLIQRKSEWRRYYRIHAAQIR